MANKDLFKQAIADAKSIREAAIANAKLALEESLTPQLKELLAQRLAEMEESDEAVVAEEVAEEATEEVVEETVEETVEEAAEEVEEETLEEAIGPDGLQAVSEEAEEEEGEGEEAGEEEAEDDSEESEDEAEEDMEIEDMTVEDLKDLIRDILSQEMGEEGEEGTEEEGEEDMTAGAEEMGAEDMTATDDEEINLEELMAELAQIVDPAAAPAPEAHGNLEEEEQIDELAEAAVNEIVAGLKGEAKEYITKMAEARGCTMQEIMKEMARYGTVSEMKSVAEMLNSMSKLGEAAFMEVANKLVAEKAAAAPAMEEEALNEIDMPTYMEFLSFIAKHPEAVMGGAVAGLGTLIAAAKAGTAAIKKIAAGSGPIADLAKKFIEKGQATAGALSPGIKEEELSEALSTIETLRNELNETNLLNAKLLYVNKVFKANNLTESQKANVIAAFDKAETVKEVKLVYETVSENATATGKKEVVREAKGFASAAAGSSTKPAVIAEANQAVLRMQKLAGIIK